MERTRPPLLEFEGAEPRGRRRRRRFLPPRDLKLLKKLLQRRSVLLACFLELLPSLLKLGAERADLSLRGLDALPVDSEHVPDFLGRGDTDVEGAPRLAAGGEAEVAGSRESTAASARSSPKPDRRRSAVCGSRGLPEHEIEERLLPGGSSSSFAPASTSSLERKRDGSSRCDAVETFSTRTT
jgi:hypothetical protein